MTFNLTIRTGSDDFHPDPAPELAKILTNLGSNIRAFGIDETLSLRDTNGNTVGTCGLEPVKVYVTTIEHKHGTNALVNRSEEGALDALYGFVAEWWDEAVPAGNGALADYEKSTAIEVYFEQVSDEFWTCTESTIDD